MIGILTKNEYFWSNSQGVWRNKTIFWKSGTSDFNDEPTFEIIDNKYVAVADIFGTIRIIEIDSKKNIDTINTELEQINAIVSSQNSNLLLTTGLQRDAHNAYIGKGFLCWCWHSKKKRNEYQLYSLSGIYNSPLYLNEKENFFLYSATNEDSAYHGKIYLYDYETEKETVVIDDFSTTDYFNYNKKTNRLIITQQNKVSLFEVQHNRLILQKYFFIEDHNPVIISINEFDNIFYIMLSDKIYTFDSKTLVSRTLKEIDILTEPSIDIGGFSDECDFCVYIDEEENLITFEI